MSTLYMIRHGQASFGQTNYDRLSPKGEQQAHIVAHHFCRLNNGFDAVYTGTLMRQQQTARAWRHRIRRVQRRPEGLALTAGFGDRPRPWPWRFAAGA